MFASSASRKLCRHWLTLIQINETPEPLWCPQPVEGCNIVADSPYARIFGLPLGHFGLVY